MSVRTTIQSPFAKPETLATGIARVGFIRSEEILTFGPEAGVFQLSPR